MKGFLLLIRPINLLIIALTMYSVRLFILTYEKMYSVQFLGNNDEELDFFLLVLSTVMIAAGGNVINDYFDGDLTALNGIHVRQPGAAFSQAAWKTMRKIAPGKTWSYSDLAEKAGSPAAVRAAGSACANNAIMLVVPCHRVVKTGGALGNYAYGVDKKQWLLSHEGFL